jgi:hypothetical protein
MRSHNLEHSKISQTGDPDHPTMNSSSDRQMIAIDTIAIVVTKQACCVSCMPIAILSPATCSSFDIKALHKCT